MVYTYFVSYAFTSPKGEIKFGNAVFNLANRIESDKPISLIEESLREQDQGYVNAPIVLNFHLLKEFQD